MKNKKIAVFAFLVIFVLSVFVPVIFVFQNETAIVSNDLGLALNETNGVIRLASGDFETTDITGIDDLFTVIQAVKETYGIKDVYKEFSYNKTIEAPFGYSHKLNQIFNGINVFGRSLNIATDSSGSVLSISGNYLKDIKTKNKIKKSAENALQTVGNNSNNAKIISTEITIYSLNNNNPIYAYNILTALNGGTRFFVDAENGKIVDIISTATNETIPTEAYKAQQTDYYNNTVEATIEKNCQRRRKRIYILPCGLP